MCLVMHKDIDFDLRDDLRSREHKLIRGWKMLFHSNGENRSIFQHYGPWKKGWHNAKDVSGRTMKAKKMKPSTPHYSYRAITAGIHIFLQRPTQHHDKRYVIQPVYFYPDEVRGARAKGAFTKTPSKAVVNRVLVKKVAKPKGNG